LIEHIFKRAFFTAVVAPGVEERENSSINIVRINGYRENMKRMPPEEKRAAEKKVNLRRGKNRDTNSGENKIAVSSFLPARQESRGRNLKGRGETKVLSAAGMKEPRPEELYNTKRSCWTGCTPKSHCKAQLMKRGGEKKEGTELWGED